MTPEIATITLAGAALTGVAYGAGPCAASCMPYLGPVFFTGDYRSQATWRIVGLFSAGRLIGYTFLAALAGYAGSTLSDALSGASGRYVLGGAMIAAGLWLALRKKKCQNSCASDGSPPPGGMLTAGFGLALTPCAPLLAINSAAALTGSVAKGAALGFAYGVGALVAPAILFGFVVSAFGQGTWNNVGRLRPVIEQLAIASMIAVGVVTAGGGMAP